MLSRPISRMPKSAASVWSSQFWLRPQVRHSLGCLERISSSTVRRTWMISGSSVVISMPASTGVQQARSILFEPAIADDADAAGGGGVQVRVLAQGGDLDLHLAGGVQDGGAARDFDGEAVDRGLDHRRSLA